MFDQYAQEAEFSIQVVSQAAKLGRRIQQEMVVTALSKQDRSPVTVADFASQAVVAQRLQDVFPEAVLVGEEGMLPSMLRPQQAVSAYHFLTADQVFLRNCVKRFSLRISLLSRTVPAWDFLPCTES